MTDKRRPAFAWHVHHDTLVELLTEPIETRRAYILKHKPKPEQRLRLRLLRPVKGKLPKAYDEARRAHDWAWKAHDEARKAYDRAAKAYAEVRKAYKWAWKAYDEARRAHDEAWKAHLPQILALHAKECLGCPWDGMTIFPSNDRYRS